MLIHACSSVKLTVNVDNPFIYTHVGSQRSRIFVIPPYLSQLVELLSRADFELFAWEEEDVCCIH